MTHYHFCTSRKTLRVTAAFMFSYDKQNLCLIAAWLISSNYKTLRNAHLNLSHAIFFSKVKCIKCIVVVSTSHLPMSHFIPSLLRMLKLRSNIPTSHLMWSRNERVFKKNENAKILPGIILTEQHSLSDGKHSRVLTHYSYPNCCLMRIPNAALRKGNS